MKASTTKKPKNFSLQRKMSYNGYVFIAPFLIGLVLVFFWAILESLNFSFGKIVMSPDGYSLVSVGLENYKTVILKEPDFLKTLFTSMGSTLFDVPVVVIFSLFLAVVLNTKMKGRALFRAILFIPVILSNGIVEKAEINNIVAGGMNAMGGIDTGAYSSLSNILGYLNIEALLHNMNISPELTGYAISLVDNIYSIVTHCGVQILIFLAGLQSISPSIYEAARVEGANGWESFWKITFPMISPMLLVNIIFSIVDSFTRASNSVMLLIHKIGFGGGEYGVASAVAWIYFVMIGLFVGLCSLVVSRLVFYQQREK